MYQLFNESRKELMSPHAPERSKASMRVVTEVISSWVLAST